MVGMKAKLKNILKLDITNKYQQLSVFTLFFCITCCLCFVQFVIQQKEFMVYDSVAEYLTVLSYWGKSLRAFFYNLFVNKKCIIQQFDFSIGLGADILTTFNWYVIGDPLNLISAFFLPEKTILLYNILLFVRLYLCGISFILYCNYKGFDLFASILGAISYIFCGWIFYCGVKHLFFIPPMIYLPLICLGVERIFDNKSPLLFILSIFFACITNFYFFYVLSILLFVYAFIRFFFITKTITVRVFCLCFVKTLFYYFIGILLSSFIFLPNIGAFLDTSRSALKIPVPLLYDLKYYFLLLFSFVAPKSFFSYSFLGFTSLSLFCMLISLYNKNKLNESYKFLLLIFFLFLLFPFFGHLFNGFNYVTNRWSFAISFIQAIILVLNVENLFTLKGLQRKIVYDSIFIFSLLAIVFSFISKAFFENFFVSYISLLITTVVLFLSTSITVCTRYKRLLLSVILILSVAINANVRYAKSQYNYLAPFFQKGSIYKLIKETPDKIIAEDFNSNSEGFFRYEAPSRYLLNNAVWFNTTGSSFYWSENSRRVMDFLNALAVSDSSSQILQSLNNRTVLQALLGVKYLFLDEGVLPPAGCEKVGEYNFNSGKSILYKNNNVLPFGFCYDKGISEGTLLEFGLAERQSILLDYCVTNKVIDNIRYYDTIDVKDVIESKYTASFDNSIILNDNVLKVKKNDAKILIDFQKTKDTENYLVLKNFCNIANNDEATVKILVNGSLYRKLKIPPSYWLWNHDYLLNLNEVKLNDDKNSIEICFEKAAEYILDDFKIVSYFTKSLYEKISNLNNNVLEDVVISSNKITGKISLQASKLLCLQIPFSKGWKIFVDGKPVDTVATNIMWTGVWMPEGFHVIEMYYETPYFRLGCYLSLLGLIILIGIIIFKKKIMNF